MASTDVLTINSAIGISKLTETGSVMKTLAADFDAGETTAFNVVLPNIEKLVRKGLIGGGAAFWGRQALQGYVTHPSLTFADVLSTDQFARLAARFLSGTITDTTVSAGAVYDHTIDMLTEADNPLLKASTMAFKAGGMDFLMGGMVGNSLQINYADGQAATYSAEYVGTGKFAYMADQTPALVLPAAIAQNYIGNTGASVTASMNDGTLFDLSTLGLMAAFSVSASNAVGLSDRRVGDAVRTGTDLESGAYVTPLTRGSDVSCSIGTTIFVDTAKRAYLAHLNNTALTDLKFKMSGKIVATTFRYEVEIIVPKAVMTTSQVQDRNGKLVVECGYEPLLATGEAGGWKLRIRNGTATLT